MPTVKARNLNCYQKFTFSVVNFTEHLFYTLGFYVGRHPRKTIFYCWLFVLLSAFGFLRFHQEKNPMKLWVPPNTKFYYDTEWLMQTYERAFRVQAAQIVADDVLEPSVLQNLLKLDIEVKNIKTESNITWSDVCFKIPKVDKGMLNLFQGSSTNKSNSIFQDDTDPSAKLNAALYCSFVDSMKNECFIKSLLDLWDSDAAVINSLTKEKIISDINTYDRNGIIGRLKKYEDLLGGIVRNASGHIVAAKSVQTLWMVQVNFTEVDMDKTGNNAGTADWASPQALEWELAYLETVENFEAIDNATLYYISSRSFGDISNATMFQDMGILSIGIIIMIIYVQFVISKFNWLEARVVLGCLGLLAVGMSFVVGCGLCSLFGISYGPVHTSLPFLLMGLGIDDMFVILACWEELSDEQKKYPMPERIGWMLKHAGVSITVTSVTDVMAFIIGSSTILPCLESYCIYAAFGVLMTFVFAVTFFTACFTLDQKRVENQRNGIIVCYKHENYVPNECSQRKLSNRAFHFVYDKLILTLPGKMFVLLITVICLGFSVESVQKLEQRFDPHWFIPKDTYFTKYVQARKHYFPTNGFEAGLYLGAINYTHELKNIQLLVENLQEQSDIALDVVSWVDPFRKYVLRNFQTDVYQEVLSDEYFDLYLSKFLFSPKNALYQSNFQFEHKLECGAPAPKIKLSSIDFRFNIFSGPEEHLPAMHRVQDLVKYSNITTGDGIVTVWSKVFSTWITDEVIETEVMRNLQLALICVMACTMLLIADIQTCFWIFICVLLTMVNVCGFMQRWGMTIDLVSCIGLELAIGLCVDYATHIGHTFLTISSGSRRERSLKTVSTIGSAVVYGGLSTLIGVLMLSQSEAYTFQSFFKIFLLVIAFGLFHGVVLMPVIFSWIGPKPYKENGNNVAAVEEEDHVDLQSLT